MSSITTHSHLGYAVLYMVMESWRGTMHLSSSGRCGNHWAMNFSTLYTPPQAPQSINPQAATCHDHHHHWTIITNHDHYIRWLRWSLHIITTLRWSSPDLILFTRPLLSPPRNRPEPDRQRGQVLLPRHDLLQLLLVGSFSDQPMDTDLSWCPGSGKPQGDRIAATSWEGKEW